MTLPYTTFARGLVAAAVGLGMAQTLTASEPGRLDVRAGQTVSPRIGLPANQQIANTIAEHLRQSGQLRNYNVDIAFQNGTAELTGNVADQAQREEALRIVQGVPGVERVRDRLTVTNAGPIVRTQAPLPEVTEVAPVAPRSAEGDKGKQPEPQPIFQAPPPSPYELNPPKMPPYAWPTYAPYNNYSRVAYPTAYPYNAWPYIGPVYPFPKIPLGWRSVKLEWEDGHWYFSKTATKQDWWRLKYW